MRLVDLVDVYRQGSPGPAEKHAVFEYTAVTIVWETKVHQFEADSDVFPLDSVGPVVSLLLVLQERAVRRLNPLPTRVYQKADSWILKNDPTNLDRTALNPHRGRGILPAEHERVVETPLVRCALICSYRSWGKPHPSVCQTPA